nr:double-cubane-cluster-containing anaerobic reductase [Sporotomaculum syntrophicum]
MIQMPDDYENYLEARKTGFTRIKDLKEQGRKMVGMFCAYTPCELISAADAIAVGLCGALEEPIAYAELKLPRNLCPLIKSSYGFALSGICPYFNNSDIIIGETTCDGKRKMYELLGEMKPMHVMQLPPSRESDLALDFWEAEVIRAKEFIEQHLGVEITDAKLRSAIKKENRLRRAILGLYELGKLNPSPISGYEIGNVLDWSEYAFETEAIIARLEDVTARYLAEYRQNLEGTQSNRPRILITGCPTGGVREKIIRRIEDLGADIVAYENCSGPRAMMDLVDEEKEPVRAIAEKYFRVNCSVLSPNPGRMEALRSMIVDYQVDGVVEVVLTACHTFAIESHYVKGLVNEEMKIPYMYIETNYSSADQGQTDTRLGAFIELLSPVTKRMKRESAGNSLPAREVYREYSD